MSDAMNHGELGIIALQSSEALGDMVDKHIIEMRGPEHEIQSYLIPIEQVRFANGEGKVKLLDSVRGKDIYILADVGNYSSTYKMFGTLNRMGPDEHFQDIKRTLSAIGGKANRVTVIMPLLYASRQHKRKGRESLDCAMALNELQNMDVATIITFDVHDPTIHNAIPNTSFENIYPTYTMIKKMIQTEGLDAIKNNMTVISPDTGAMDRAIYYANVLGLDVGMFYKRRDHTRVVNGKNPIVQHEYIGGDLAGKNVLIVDDMIASGESIVDIINEISDKNIKNAYVATTFAFFTEGVEKFDKLYEEGKLIKLYTTNLSYIPEEVKAKPWFVEVDLSKFIAKIVNTLSFDHSISHLLDATARIRQLIQNTMNQ
ncbi:MAG: phosphoribosylpyrophosphate synthetase [Clostridiales bacterium GWF2_38_85]|nr:MAG: phosphoribosylpyrophosphate synthetase [Clostridiales bacterium GWF2_38_85]HBL84092.1 phosphoribosylpyrophosphate synthetase [Clostridiales bacterium]